MRRILPLDWYIGSMRILRVLQVRYVLVHVAISGQKVGCDLTDRRLSKLFNCANGNLTLEIYIKLT